MMAKVLSQTSSSLEEREIDSSWKFRNGKNLANLICIEKIFIVCSHSYVEDVVGANRGSRSPAHRPLIGHPNMMMAPAIIESYPRSPYIFHKESEETLVKCMCLHVKEWLFSEKLHNNP